MITYKVMKKNDGRWTIDIFRGQVTMTRFGVVKDFYPEVYQQLEDLGAKFIDNNYAYYPKSNSNDFVSTTMYYPSFATEELANQALEDIVLPFNLMQEMIRRTL